MPESVIKRLNELALEDGRVKGKGELAIRATSFEQDGDSKKGMPDVLPDTIEAAVNNGIDPTLAALDSEDFPDIINDMPDEPEHSEGRVHGGDRQRSSVRSVTRDLIDVGGLEHRRE